jgi:hypothetical protein
MTGPCDPHSARVVACMERVPCGRICHAPTRPTWQVDRALAAALQVVKMQATIPMFPRLTTTAPLGRGPDLNMALDLSVAASSQVTLAVPRLVVRTSPPSATASATPGNPGSVAICSCAS